MAVGAASAEGTTNAATSRQPERGPRRIALAKRLLRPQVWGSTCEGDICAPDMDVHLQEGLKAVRARRLVVLSKCLSPLVARTQLHLGERPTRLQISPGT